MKKLVALTTALLIAFSLYVPNVLADERITLVWFTEQKDDVEVERMMKYIINPFEEKYPNIHIELAPTADYEQVLKIQLSAGGGPDIVNMGGPTITAEYVTADKILELTEHVIDCGLDKEIFPWALNACKVNGRIYSLPNSYEALLFWINDEMFAEKGWTVPTNYQELEAFASAAMADGIIPIAFGTSDFKAVNEQFISVALACYAGRDNVAKALRGELKWTDAIFVDAINKLNEMWQKGWINDKKSHAISGDDSSALWYSGIAATRMTGTWALGDFSRNVPFDYSAVPFPSLNDDVVAAVPMGAGGVVAINAATKHPKECFDFLRFMFLENEKNMAMAIAEGEQPLPMDFDNSQYPATMHPVDLEVIQMMDKVMEKVETSGHVMWSYWPAETRLYMMDNIEKIYLGELTTEKYLEITQSIFEKELEAGLVPAV